MINIKITNQIDKAKAASFIKKLIPNAILCSGIFLISIGAGMVYKPAGYITLGVLSILALLVVDFKD